MALFTKAENVSLFQIRTLNTLMMEISLYKGPSRALRSIEYFPEVCNYSSFNCVTFYFTHLIQNKQTNRILEFS